MSDDTTNNPPTPQDSAADTETTKPGAGNVVPFHRKKPGGVDVFSFGDPTPALEEDFRDFAGSFLCQMGSARYYSPPLSWQGLAKLMGSNPYHSAILHFKKNILCRWYEPVQSVLDKPILGMADFRAAALDFAVFENAYFQVFKNRLGNIVRLARLPAMAMRRGKEPGQFFMLRPSTDLHDDHFQQEPVEFARGEVVHVKGNCVRQQIYGTPGYLGGIQAVLLSEDATLFRRRYYRNGAHMGYILVTQDGYLDELAAKRIEESVKKSKGIGNFQSLYINIARSQAREPVQLIPVGNIGSKDEFQRIKEASEQELLATHRVPPNLIGIIPVNSAGLGNPETTLKFYHEAEVVPIQDTLREINDQLGVEVIKFNPPSWSA